MTWHRMCIHFPHSSFMHFIHSIGLPSMRSSSNSPKQAAHSLLEILRVGVHQFCPSIFAFFRFELSFLLPVCLPQFSVSLLAVWIFFHSASFFSLQLPFLSSLCSFFASCSFFRCCFALGIAKNGFHQLFPVNFFAASAWTACQTIPMVWQS